MKLISALLLPALALSSLSVSLTAPSKNIVDLAVATPDLSTLVTALKAANLTGALSGNGPFTVFAPTNEAFASIPPAILKHLLEPCHIAKLQAVLEYHVISGAAVYAKDLKAFQKVETLEGDDVFIAKKSSRIFINKRAQVTTADVGATNGVVHIIDHVLLPRHITETDMSSAAVTYLATFDGTKDTTWDFVEVNDPVMGGQSVGTFTVDTAKKVSIFNGTVAIVPFLKAPGFCNVMSQPNPAHKFADVSSMLKGALVLKVRSTTPEFKGFKVGFGAMGVPKKSRYGNPSFKAPFSLNGTEWQEVSIPFTSFSYDWSPFTGECGGTDPDGTHHYCCTGDHPEVCPTATFLSVITDVEFWAEGFAGNYHLEIQWVGAGGNIN